MEEYIYREGPPHCLECGRPLADHKEGDGCSQSEFPAGVDRAKFADYILRRVEQMDRDMARGIEDYTAKLET